MILSKTCIDFRSLRRLERSCPASPVSFGSLSFRLFRSTFYSWRLLQGSVDCEDDAYGPPDSFISKSYVSCTQCSLVNKVFSLSNVFCDVLLYGLAFSLLAFPWGRISTSSEYNNLLEQITLV